MQLHQVEAIGPEVAETVFGEPRQVLLVVAGGGVRREAAAGFGGDHDLFLTLAFELRDEALAMAHAVDVGSVDEVHAAIDGLRKRGQGFGVVHAAPGAANGPRAKTDFGNLPAGPAQRSISHDFQSTAFARGGACFSLPVFHAARLTRTGSRRRWGRKSRARAHPAGAGRP